MPAVKDGQYLGHKFHGVRPGAPVKLLGFKNGDLITGIDGSPVIEESFLAEVRDRLARGGLTLQFERKGVLQRVAPRVRDSARARRRSPAAEYDQCTT